MALLIHANIRITGTPEELSTFREQVNGLLLDDYSDADVEERHREGELVYDFKVSGGIPFPPFVAASGSHPDVAIQVEWVNAEAGVKGYAAIENGALKETRTEKLEGEAELPELTAISLAADGKLLLALSLLTRGPKEFLGYAVTYERDALIRAVKPREQSAELYASSGDAPQWEEKWLIDFAERSSEYAEITEPMEETVYQALRAHAEAFAAEWVWFDSGSAEETAIERERFRLAQYPIHPANLKYEKLRRLMTHQPALEFSSLSEDLRWVKEAVQQCWAEDNH
ncbi:MAG: hypothetical protein ACREV9_03360 [Burkholderiales bacterium]